VKSVCVFLSSSVGLPAHIAVTLLALSAYRFLRE
jgi:hypothetical protein